MMEGIYCIFLLLLPEIRIIKCENVSLKSSGHNYSTHSNELNQLCSKTVLVDVCFFSLFESFYVFIVCGVFLLVLIINDLVAVFLCHVFVILFVVCAFDWHAYDTRVLLSQ